MRYIILTNLQRERILEMCKSLFPEHIFSFTNALGNVDTPYLNVFVCRKNIYNTMLNRPIHWYEFIMTHLVEKLFVPDPKRPDRNLKEKFCSFFWNTNMWWSDEYMKKEEVHIDENDILHPINYLYQYFITKK